MTNWQWKSQLYNLWDQENVYTTALGIGWPHAVLSSSINFARKPIFAGPGLY